MSKDKLYLVVLGFALASSSIIKWEPAPYDILMVILMGWGAAAGYFHINSIPKKPILFLSLLIIPNIIFIMFKGDTAGAIRFFAITFYLILTWLFFILILDKFKIEGFRYVFYGYALSALASVVAGLIAIVFFLNHSPLLFGGFRLMSFFKDPNVLGPYMIPMVLLSLVALYKAEAKMKVLWAAVFALANLGVLLSFSRAAVLNEFLAWAVFLALFFCNPANRNPRQVKQVAAAVLLVTAMILGLLLSNNLLGKALLYRAGLHTYDADRFTAYQQTLHLSVENPWGIGPGQTLTRLPMATHNTYLRVLLENGWPGFMGLMGFLILSVYNIMRMAIYRRSRFRVLYICITAALIGILANSIFIDTLHWRHFWVILALAWVDFDSDLSESVWY